MVSNLIFTFAPVVRIGTSNDGHIDLTVGSCSRSKYEWSSSRSQIKLLGHNCFYTVRPPILGLPVPKPDNFKELADGTELGSLDSKVL